MYGSKAVLRPFNNNNNNNFGGDEGPANDRGHDNINDDGGDTNDDDDDNDEISNDDDDPRRVQVNAGLPPLTRYGPPGDRYDFRSMRAFESEIPQEWELAKRESIPPRPTLDGEPPNRLELWRQRCEIRMQVYRDYRAAIEEDAPDVDSYAPRDSEYPEQVMGLMRDLERRLNEAPRLRSQKPKREGYSRGHRRGTVKPPARGR